MHHGKCSTMLLRLLALRDNRRMVLPAMHYQMIGRLQDFFQCFVLEYTPVTLPRGASATSAFLAAYRVPRPNRYSAKVLTSVVCASIVHQTKQLVLQAARTPSSSYWQLVLQAARTPRSSIVEFRQSHAITLSFHKVYPDCRIGI